MPNTSLTDPGSLPPLMRAALTAASAGHAVFPLWPRSKRPVFEGWESAATTDSQWIRDQWSATPYNIGIACGPSRLLVIDLDDADGHRAPPQWEGAKHGYDVLARLAAANGEPFPDGTYTVATPTGYHLYFQAPETPTLRSSVGRLGWRIDTRGDGGFVVAPGSIRAGGAYRVLRRQPIAPLPQWLVAALTPPPAPEPSPVTIDAGHLDAYIEAAVTAESSAVATAPSGTRHTTLLHAAISLGTLVGAEVLDYDHARIALHNAAAGLGDDFPAREIHRTVEDGLVYGIQRPRTLLPRSVRTS
ncbi:bifunctional DNA primase/polymerase [Saccharopolyspora sp. SCSIO 74807]|uniref:bifunctional DNA primase/polymerase n=1 Tax=Saccharopolyspora sp. SCSIO 74807 TaxID=3118084 RepID=UPI0030D5FA10